MSLYKYYKRIVLGAELEKINFALTCYFFKIKAQEKFSNSAKKYIARLGIDANII
jgi:hypothetical protein